MAKYEVELPVIGYATFEIDANSLEEVAEKAIKKLMALKDEDLRNLKKLEILDPSLELRGKNYIYNIRPSIKVLNENEGGVPDV